MKYLGVYLPKKRKSYVQKTKNTDERNQRTKIDGEIYPDHELEDSILLK